MRDVSSDARSVFVVWARRVLVGCLSVTVLALAVVVTSLSGSGAAAATSATSVRLVLRHRAYRAGQSITITVVNDTRSLVLRGLCVELQRQDAGRWVTVNHTHGIAVPWVQAAGVPQPTGTRSPLGLPL